MPASLLYMSILGVVCQMLWWYGEIRDSPASDGWLRLPVEAGHIFGVVVCALLKLSEVIPPFGGFPELFPKRRRNGSEKPPKEPPLCPITTRQFHRFGVIAGSSPRTEWHPIRAPPPFRWFSFKTSEIGGKAYATT